MQAGMMKLQLCTRIPEPVRQIHRTETLGSEVSRAEAQKSVERRKKTYLKRDSECGMPDDPR